MAGENGIKKVLFYFIHESGSRKTQNVVTLRHSSNVYVVRTK